MAFRPLLRRRAVLPATAVVIAASSILYPKQTALAEFPESYSDRRKPIYDEFPSTSAQAPTTTSPTPGPLGDALRHPTPTDRLAAHIRVTRLSLYSNAVRTEDSLNKFMSRVLDLEHNFTETIASLAPPKESNEKLLPGVLYVLVSSMAGSIVTRNRNIVLRSTVPVAVGIAMGWAVLPITMRNIGDLVWKWEEKVPAISETHIRIRDSVDHARHLTMGHWDLATHKINEFVSRERDKVEGWVRKGR